MRTTVLDFCAVVIKICGVDLNRLLDFASNRENDDKNIKNTEKNRLLTVKSVLHYNYSIQKT